MARLSGGAVMAWGGNSQGQLGNGTEAGSDVPVAVCATGTVGPCPGGPYLSGVKALAAGGFGPNDGGLQSYSLALLANGSVAAWGVSERGELGDGSSTGPEKCNEMLQSCSKTPVAVSGLSGVTTVAARGAHSLALLENGAVMSWGDNKNGQLGDGMSSGPGACGGIEPTRLQHHAGGGGDARRRGPRHRPRVTNTASHSAHSPRRPTCPKPAVA